MRYVNQHLELKVFKSEGLKDLANLAEKGDYAVSFDLMSGYCHVGLPKGPVPSSDFSGRGSTKRTIAFRLAFQQPLGFSQK